MNNLISSLTLLGLSLLNPVSSSVTGGFLAEINEARVPEQVLSEKSIDMTVRYPDPWVNEVFSDNILLNLHYLKGDVESLKDAQDRIDWEKVRQSFAFSFELQPGQTFAYHPNISPEFKDKNVLAANTTFWSSEGYKSDGYLVGDGVCHLASLFNWASQEARLPDGQASLSAVAKVRHDFLPVPGIPREYGTSVFYSPDGGHNSANQNLYITNNYAVPVKFNISADGKKVEIRVSLRDH